MKKIFLLTSLIISSALAQASNITFNEVLLKKNMKSPIGVSFTSYFDVQQWCTKRGTAFEISSYQVAQELEKLEDGLFRCLGQFTQLIYEPIHAFQITKCTAMDPEEMQLQCPEP